MLSGSLSPRPGCWRSSWPLHVYRGYQRTAEKGCYSALEVGWGTETSSPGRTNVIFITFITNRRDESKQVCGRKSWKKDRFGDVTLDGKIDIKGGWRGFMWFKTHGLRSQQQVFCSHKRWGSYVQLKDSLCHKKTFLSSYLPIQNGRRSRPASKSAQSLKQEVVDFPVDVTKQESRHVPISCLLMLMVTSLFVFFLVLIAT